jgi:hypothetical protein
MHVEFDYGIMHHFQEESSAASSENWLFIAKLEFSVHTRGMAIVALASRWAGWNWPIWWRNAYGKMNGTSDSGG